MTCWHIGTPLGGLAFGGLWLSHPEFRPLAAGIALVLVIVAVMVAARMGRGK